MQRLGFTYNVDQCVGCKACQVACKDKNHLELGSFFRKVETIASEGEYIHFSGACNHCEEPGCVKACPTGAMHKAEDGTVQHTSGKCIGCGMCVWHCPYGAVKFSSQKGIARKCNACIDLREKGEKPACVQACITHCLDFGPIEIEAGAKHPSYLPPTDITHPSLVIIEEKQENECHE